MIKGLADQKGISLSTRAPVGLVILILGVLLIPSLSLVVTSRAQRDIQDGEWGTPCSLPHPTACFVGTAIPGVESRQGERSSVVQPQSSPLAVELLCFNVYGGDGAVEVEWQTATELETAGFFLMRSRDEGEEFQNISDFIVHCDDGGLVGGYYTFRDEAVNNGQQYLYKLVEVVSAQETNEYGPLAVIPAVPTATFTPSASPTPSPTATPTATYTPTPTPTSDEGTSTQVPSVRGNPTDTPRPTATATVYQQATGTPTPDSTTGPSPTTPSPTETESAGTALPVPSHTFTPNAVVAQSTDPLPETPTIVVGGGSDELPGATPQAVVQVEGTATAYPGPLPSLPADTPQATIYPPPIATPQATLLPTAYQPPASGQTFQMATMTPSPSQLDTDEEGAKVPRLWMYAGFFLTLLLLGAGFAGFSQKKRRRPIYLSAPPEEDWSRERRSKSLGRGE